MKYKKHITNIASYSFIGLWSIAALLKLANPATSKVAMRQQLFPLWMADILWWLLPVVQILLLMLLLYRPLQRLGIKLSTLLLASYTVYLLLAVTAAFGSIPCSCGGIWASNKHWMHIALNSPFLIIGIISWVLPNRYPRPAASLDQEYVEGSKLKADRSEDSALSQQKGGSSIS